MRIPDNKRHTLVKQAVLCFFLGIKLTTAPVLAEPEQAAQQSSFDLLELRVQGNTLLEKTVLEKTVYPFLGVKKTIDTVEDARTALEKVYHDQGYQTVAVDIPEQNVKNGVIYLKVVEGKVSRIRVKDSRYFDLGAIKEGVPELKEGNVPNLPKMQEQISTLSAQSVDRKITPVLRAGDTPGTLEVDLKVKDSLPFHGRVEMNGRNTASTTLTRLVTTLHYDNLWQKLHSASLMYQVSPEDNQEVDVWAGTYVMPVPMTNAKFAFYAISSTSNAQIASAGALSVVGIGHIYGARLIKPLSGLGSYNHSMTVGFDHKEFTEDLNLIGADTIKTPITYVPFMAEYSGSYRGEKYFASFNTGVKFSIRGLGNDHTEFKNKRDSAQSNYSIFTGGLNYTRELPYGLEFASRINGQKANSPLISNEQFSMGGALNVRGYFETQALADSGAFGSFELYSPNLNHLDNAYFNNFKLFTFIDGTTGWVQSPLPGQKNQYQLAASGAGFNFHIKKYLLATFDVGIPLMNLGDVKTGDPRFNFNIATEF